MNVLITGAAGQLGRELQRVFADCDVVAADRSMADITDRDAVDALVDGIKPDLIVHSAAFTAVDRCETEVETAFAANATGAMHVARAAQRVGAGMVHLSTDYVFDGLLGRPYTEFDAVNPRSAYGRSKEAGEQLVRSHCERHWIVRTQWVHGVEGGNFARTMLRLGRERGAVSVVDDQSGSPAFTFDLAPQIRRLVETGIPGTYHVSNEGECTWFEFAAAVFEAAGLDVALSPTDTASFGAPAPRPAYSVLDNLMTRQIGLPAMPHWRESLPTLIQQLT